MDLGVKHIDVAVGGTGGCPFAKGSAGNLATEQFLELLDRQGIKHTVKNAPIASANALLEQALGRELIQARELVRA